MLLFAKRSFYVDCTGDEYKANDDDDDDDANPPILLSVTYDGVHQVCVISEPAVSSKLHNPIMLLLLLLLLLVLHYTSVLCQFLALNVVISMQFNLTDTGNTSSQN